MSAQQKIIFAACVFAGLMAIVSSQSMDPNNCAREGQKLFTEYIRNFQRMISEYTSSLSSSTQESLNISQINSEVNELAESYAGLTNVDQGFNAQQLLTSGSGILQKQMKLLMRFMNPQMGIQGLQSSIDLNGKVLNSYMKLLTSLSRVCMPRN